MTTPTNDGERIEPDWLDDILKKYTSPKNVEDKHGNVYYDFAFIEAKKAIRAELTKARKQLKRDLFPEYDKVDNPGYTFMISKQDLDPAFKQECKS
ncbi:MAG TPA: hypothetical protein VNX65_02295 [Patescibacteria group bacterium]|jgi:hypothetical protein|nr:hypothetical protein [Patescibacteria group bacterium]